MYHCVNTLTCFEIESKPEAFLWLEPIQEISCEMYTDEQISSIRKLLMARDEEVKALRDEHERQ